MKYQNPSFSVAYGGTDYSKGWDRTFGKTEEPVSTEPPTIPIYSMYAEATEEIVRLRKRAALWKRLAKAYRKELAAWAEDYEELSEEYAEELRATTDRRGH